MSLKNIAYRMQIDAPRVFVQHLNIKSGILEEVHLFELKGWWGFVDG